MKGGFDAKMWAWGPATGRETYGGASAMSGRASIIRLMPKSYESWECRRGHLASPRVPGSPRHSRWRHPLEGEGTKRLPLHFSSHTLKTKGDIATNICIPLPSSISRIVTKGIFQGSDSFKIGPIGLKKHAV